MRKRKMYNLNPNMRVITINLSSAMVTSFQILQDLGMYPSRSEAIRAAMRDFLTHELEIPINYPKSKLSIQKSIETYTSDMRKMITTLIEKLRAEDDI